MTSLRPWDRRLAWMLGSVWVLGFTLSLLGLRQPSSSPFFVSRAESAEAPPRVVEFADWANDRANAEDYPVRIGDGILRVDGHDLQGRGPVAYRFFRSAAASRNPERVEMTLLRDGRILDVVVDTSFQPYYAPLLVASLVHAVVALLILVRAPSTSEVRPIFMAFMFYALSFAWYFNGPAPLTAFGLVLAVTGSLLAHPLMVRAFLSFPAEAKSLRGFNHVWPWCFVPLGLLSLSYNIGIPWTPDQVRSWLVAGTFVYIGTMVAIATMNFRRVGAPGRRQIRWIVFGVYVAAVPAVVFFAWLLQPDSIGVAWTASVSAVTILYPMTMLIAISRYDFFDIDRVFGSTLTYSLLLVSMVGIGAVTARYATRWILPTAEAEAERFFSQLAITLSLAWVFVSGPRRLRPWIDRVVFPERVALQHGVDRLLARLGGTNSPARLVEQAGRSLVKLCDPERFAIYWQSNGVYQAIFAYGSVIPPVFQAGQATARVLAELRQATEVSDLSRQPMSPMERTMLDNLAEVVVPVVHHGHVAALVLIGEKRSGDVYTPSDLALLSAVGTRLSNRLDRFDRREVLAGTRQMRQQALRYVPGTMARQLTGDGTLDVGESHVSVLFVDLRGHASGAENHASAAVLSTDTRYTRLVSRIVDRYGGSVVEFNGDGMMAVFGAPGLLAVKEKAALLAGLDIVTESSPRSGTAHQQPEVGIGIATGTAFIGTISAVGRSIWTVTGSTPNRAARLQALTRTLDCSLLIDGATRAGAGDVADDLRDMGVRVIREVQREEQQLFGAMWEQEPLPVAG